MTTVSEPEAPICANCGAPGRPGAKFCKGCGAPVVQAASGAADPVSALQQAEVMAVAATPSAYAKTDATAVQWNVGGFSLSPVVVAGALALALAAGGGVTWLFLKQKADAAIQVQMVQAYPTRLTRVRDKPTSIGSTILGNVHRGDVVSGTWVDGADGQTRWLKMKWGENGEAYVWGANLNSSPLPTLTRAFTEKRIVLVSSQLYAQPQLGSAVIEPLSPGTDVEIAGELADGWLEVARKSGGVAYVQAAAFVAPVVETLSRVDGTVVVAPYGVSSAIGIVGNHRICFTLPSGISREIHTTGMDMSSGWFSAPPVSDQPGDAVRFVNPGGAPATVSYYYAPNEATCA